MGKFSSGYDFWNFRREVTRNRRYIRSLESENFLSIVAATCLSRIREIPAPKIFWRAQNGHGLQYEENIDAQVECPFDPERMKPLSDRSPEGRINPKGIPFLYLSNNLETAISECRPWVGGLVSAGQFRTIKDLKIVDCTVHTKEKYFVFEEVPEAELEEAIWSQIDNAFSQPTTRSDDTAEYVVTQVLAELFREKGYDGVAYRSANGSGFNLAFFDLGSAKLINCGLYKVKKVKVDFDETTNPYFIRES